ncbi:hypothetical protein RF11_11058 [Thelohanellus kitauei]|uniref:Uncharacterized protein n=1 Tax=Thelohanellus kitauei TaxID=669202 RepID=A0A0C2IVL5_THEKT|nr:hypothetical protein RF11_11058 [Thelohanellus kitauei]
MGIKGLRAEQPKRKGLGLVTLLQRFVLTMLDIYHYTWKRRVAADNVKKSIICNFCGKCGVCLCLKSVKTWFHYPPGHYCQIATEDKPRWPITGDFNFYNIATI